MNTPVNLVPGAADAARPPLARLRLILYGLVIVAWLLQRCTGSALAGMALSLFTIPAILVSLPALSGMALFLSLFFLTAGSAMLWTRAAGAAGWLSCFGQMAHLLALFSLVPVLALPVRLFGYGTAITCLLQAQMRSAAGLNRLTTGLAYACGSFMSMASLPIMYASLKPVLEGLPLSNRTRFIVASITCSHLLAMLWSPVSGVLGAILSGLKLPWWTVVPALLPLSLLSLVAGWLAFSLVDPDARLRFAVVEPDQAMTGQAVRAARRAATRKLAQMLVVILLLVAMTVGLEQWLRLGLVTIVVLSVIPFTLAWGAALKQVDQLLPALVDDLVQRLPRMAEMFAIFMCGGFFAAALNVSGYVHEVNELMLALRSTVGPLVFLLVLPLLAIVAALLGMHPLVAIAVLAESLRPEVVGISATALAISLTGGALLAYMLGPFGGTVGLASILAGVSPWRVTVWNLPYALPYLALLLLALCLLPR